MHVRGQMEVVHRPFQDSVGVAVILHKEPGSDEEEGWSRRSCGIPLASVRNCPQPYGVEPHTLAPPVGIRQLRRDRELGLVLGLALGLASGLALWLALG